MDRRIALARRLRHDLDAGIEDLVAGKDQLGLAAAEQLGEERAELAVDRVVGFLQLLARLAVDAADRVFQRVDRGGKVGRLFVEEALAFACAAQLFQRREVHRAERLDLVAEARDFALQTAVAQVGRQIDGQRFFVFGADDMGLDQAFLELFDVELGRLLLELEVVDLVARGLQALFELEAFLVESAQLPGGHFQCVAFFGQHAFVRTAHGEGRLQLFLHHRVADRGKVLLCNSTVGRHLRQLGPGRLGSARVVSQFGMAFLLGKAGILRLARQLMLQRPCLAQGGVALALQFQCGIHGLTRRFERLTTAGDFILGAEQRRALILIDTGDIFQIARDLAGTLVITGLCLGELEGFHLSGVQPLLCFLQVAAHLGKRL